MKSSAFMISTSRFTSQRTGAFTMPEMMVAMAVFSLVIAAVLACHLAGLEFNEFVRPKVQNAQYARQVISRIVEQVRCAAAIQVGTGTTNSFTPVPANKRQVGNAVRIFTTTNATPYFYYYQDSFVSSLVMIPVSSSSGQTIATCVTNTAVFSLEDFSGNVLSNNANNAVFSMLVQMLRPSNKAGMSDAYQIRVKTTRRTIL
jgi:prepilin-type N-terminal cleavage/methylation domain-containing protein